jgi:ABC transporter
VTVPAPSPADTDHSAARAVGLWKVYGEGDTRVVALSDVSVAFSRGRYTAIMGPSGSGKSTLMHCMAALDSATAGQVFVGDTELTTLNDAELTRLRRDKIGFVFQAYNLVPTLTAQENITLPLDIAGKAVDREWFDTVISTVGLGDRLRHKPNGRSPADLTSSSPTSQREISTPAPEPRSWASCVGRSASSARRSSWSPMTPMPRHTRITSSSSSTARSSTRCPRRRPSACWSG